MMTVQIISIGHVYTTAAERQAYRLDEQQLASFRATLRVMGAVGSVMLQTCNRLELILEADADIRAEAAAAWSAIVSADPLPPDSIKTYYGNTPCMRYLLQLASGLKSAILGDDQIIHQMKKAWEEARSARHLSTLLERSYQAYMRYHKQVCRETDFKSHSISLAYHTWRTIQQRVHNLHDKKVLIVGAGDMARQALKYVAKFKPQSVYLCNRTYAKAEAIAPSSTVLLPYDEIDTVQADIIINCSPVGMSYIAEAITAMPAVIADLALPTSYELKAASEVIELEQLQKDISMHHHHRMGSLPKVMRLLEEHVAEYTVWVLAWEQRRAEHAEAA